MKPILQIALDTPDLFKALELATSIVSETGCKNIWLEAGTPLIKAWGKLSVKLLKDLSKCFIVADTKTMDTGGLEAEIFYKAGADAFTVLGLADNSTIEEAVEKKKEYGRKLIIDLINHPKPFERALELDNYDIDIILYHVGIDVQVRRRITITDLLEELRKLVKQLNTGIAVAGGIKYEDVEKFKEVGVDVIVVGGAITRSENPVESAKIFLEKITKN